MAGNFKVKKNHVAKFLSVFHDTRRSFRGSAGRALRARSAHPKTRAGGGWGWGGGGKRSPTKRLNSSGNAPDTGIDHKSRKLYTHGLRVSRGLRAPSAPFGRKSPDLRARPAPLPAASLVIGVVIGRHASHGKFTLDERAKHGMESCTETDAGTFREETRLHTHDPVLLDHSEA